MPPQQQKLSFLKRPVSALLILPSLAILFNIAFLKGGFWGDDFFFLNLINNDSLPVVWWRGLWSAENFTGFEYIWWKDADWSAYFWRPLPSLIIQGSIKLFGENPFPLHLLSLLLHAGVTTTLYILVRKLSGRHGLAFLAALFFVACEDHAFTVSWISTITDLFCVQFIILALLLHARWLRQRRPMAMAGSLLALVLALASKETALAAPVAMILMSLFFPTGAEDDRGESTIGRVKLKRFLGDRMAWLPAAVVLIAFVIFYRTVASGEMRTLLYLDPLTQPVEYLVHLVWYFPIMWLATFSHAPPFLPIFFPDLIAPYVVVGAVTILLGLTALWPFRSRPLALWAFGVYLAALLPQLCTDASERNLYFPVVAACILIALVAGSINPIARRMLPGHPLRPRWTRLMGWAAIVLVLIPGILISAARPWAMLPSLARDEKDLMTALPYIEQNQPEHTLILNASSSFVALYAYYILDYHTEQPQKIWLLSGASGVFSLERTGDSSFVIRADRHGWIDSWFARVMRTNENLYAGRTYETPAFTATLVKMTDDGRDALEVRFDLNYPLDHPGWLFLRWNGTAFEPLNIAAMGIGESVELADTSDLWKLMMRTE